FVSRASAAFFPDTAYYPRQLAAWERRLREVGAEAVTRVATAEQIRALGPHRLVVAPAALCLAAAEVEALEQHIAAGGHLVIDWATGARGAGCEWLGWEVVRTLTAAVDVRELEPRDGLYLVVPAGSPLAAGLDPATRIELRAASQLALTVRGPHVYWADWALNAAPAASGGEADAAAWHRTTERGGRVVWFGFRPGQAAQAEDAARLEALLRNGLRWAAGLAYAEIAPWPHGHRAALVLSEDVEAEFPNAAALAALARRKGVPATFFVVSQLALEQPDLASVLAAAGEVGGHTSDHLPVVGLAAGDQRTRLRRNWTELRGWTGTAPVGLRPPEELFDAATLLAWREAGGLYIAGVNNARSAAPEILPTPAGSIVLLPRVMKDDYNVFVQESALRRERLRDAYLEGMRKVRAVGGLALVTLHTQVGGQPNRLVVVGDVIDSAQAERHWWIATGGDVARWWLARADATLVLDEREHGTLEVAVTAPPAAALAGAVVELFLPGGGDGWTPAGVDAALVHERAADGLRLILDSLAPGETRRLVIRSARAP
ncbi:MAG: polysaccharide deacetylase family protein, partial [Gemmatimonadales bacterium]